MSKVEEIYAVHGPVMGMGVNCGNTYYTNYFQVIQTVMKAVTPGHGF